MGVCARDKLRVSAAVDFSLENDLEMEALLKGEDFNDFAMCDGAIECFCCWKVGAKKEADEICLLIFFSFNVFRASRFFRNSSYISILILSS